MRCWPNRIFFSPLPFLCRSCYHGCVQTQPIRKRESSPTQSCVHPLSERIRWRKQSTAKYVTLLHNPFFSHRVIFFTSWVTSLLPESERNSIKSHKIINSTSNIPCHGRENTESLMKIPCKINFISFEFLKLHKLNS